MELYYNTLSKEFVIALKGKRTYSVSLGTDIYGNITRLDKEIERFSDNLLRCRERLETLKTQFEIAKVEAVKAFPQEQKLAEKTERLGELNALLDVGKSDKVMLDEEPEEGEPEPEKKRAVLER